MYRINIVDDQQIKKNIECIAEKNVDGRNIEMLNKCLYV